MSSSAAPHPVDALTFDLDGYEVEQEEEFSVAWINQLGVVNMLQFHPYRPNWPFDLTDLAAASKFYRQQCLDNNGVMLEMSVKDWNGYEVLSGLFKYRSPLGNRLGMHYVGIFWIPFENCMYQINMESLERGTTGGREAAVMLIEGDDRWPKKKDDAPIVVTTAEEMFARMAQAPVVQLPSDEVRWDEQFPDHPLSKVRARMKRVLSTLELDKRVPKLRHFRV